MPAETMISILGATLVAAAWALWVLPIGTCSECSHCRAEKVAKERATEAQVSRVYGIPLCQACGRHQQRGEDHRH